LIEREGSIPGLLENDKIVIDIFRLIQDIKTHLKLSFDEVDSGLKKMKKH